MFQEAYFPQLRQLNSGKVDAQVLWRSAIVQPGTEDHIRVREREGETEARSGPGQLATHNPRGGF